MGINSLVALRNILLVVSPAFTLTRRKEKEIQKVENEEEEEEQAEDELSKK